MADSDKPAPAGAAPLTAEQTGALYEGLKAAGLGGRKITSLHLAADAPADGDPCHSVQMPDGSWIVVC